MCAGRQVYVEETADKVVCARDTSQLGLLEITVDAGGDVLNISTDRNNEFMVSFVSRRYMRGITELNVLWFVCPNIYL